ncbi:N-acetylglucosamine-6-phosphate deacetylase [Deltaproteobacteria bacterium Smac51]|nr:N-acetylglucosamine-6-phosphate deacetylase [Deltaproteobacteria bacterium Smac51]
MTGQALINARIFDGYAFGTDRAVIVEGALIKDVVPTDSLPKGLETLDLQGATLAPGFIDLQINGCGGVLFNDDISEETLETMHQTCLRFGCTSFLPTLITSPAADFKRAVEVAASYYVKKPWAILGVHLEGPFISQIKRGTHNDRYIRPLDMETVDFLCQWVKKVPIVLTAAPEENDPQLLRRLALAGVRLSLGHTNATYEEALAGIANGMHTATHLFNAMSAFDRNNPGAVGAVLNSSVYTGLIVDGMHSSFHTANLVKKIKGERVYIVTDAVTPMGTDMKEFRFADQRVLVVDGKCINEHGGLAGSNITMIASVRNAVLQAGIDEAEALKMATLYPAAMMGVEVSIGGIRPGMAANLIAYDRNFNLTAFSFCGMLQQLAIL